MCPDSEALSLPEASCCGTHEVLAWFSNQVDSRDSTKLSFKSQASAFSLLYLWNTSRAEREAHNPGTLYSGRFSNPNLRKTVNTVFMKTARF
jgi:hypothetical protein